jgi:hypothetical protein
MIDQARLAGIYLLLTAAVGCDAPALPTAPKAASTTPVAAPPEEERPMVAGAPGEPLPEDEIPVTDIPRKFTANDPIQGRRSRRVREGTNPLGIGTTAAAGFYAKFQSMILAIDHANQLYWPQHNFEYPKTQEVFMKEVVEPALNGVPLPELPEDEEYCYVPSQAEVGLQIRLKPGSPRSKVPAGTMPEEAIKMLAGQEQPAGEQAQGEPGETEPSPNIRERAEQIGEQSKEGLSEEAQKRGVAPGGLVPVGGIE